MKKKIAKTIKEACDLAKAGFSYSPRTEEFKFSGDQKITMTVRDSTKLHGTDELEFVWQVTYCRYIQGNYLESAHEI